MCGIAGITSVKNHKIDEDTLKRMTDILKHRGPDDSGIYFSHIENLHRKTKLNVGLGHRRLSIIDLQSGHQPMSNEDRTIWIVYNGEIYNFPELRERLLKKGHRFSTKSDTEVIIHLYEEYDVECLKSLRGMFAFCIWDVKKGRLFLARDRIGQKPLFFYCKNGVMLFASEIKSLLECEYIRQELDLYSLDGYLTYGYVPPPCTIFKHIYKLLPAHYLTYDGDNVRIERYWELDYTKKKKISFSECQQELYQLLNEATEIRLVSDVPLGAFLSGGVDSSCVVALMSKISSEKIKTFTIGFSDDDFDELKYARFISKRFNTEHREFIVRPNALEILPKIVWHYDQPFGDSSCIPTYYVSKMTRDFVTVALSGDGGDEVFAGYRRYIGIRLASFLKYFPHLFIKTAYNISYSSPYARRFFTALVKNTDIISIYVDWFNYFTNEQKKNLYSNSTKTLLKIDDGNKERSYADRYLRNIIEDSKVANINIVEKMMYGDIKSYLPEDLLVKVDIATMANSLESRSPFLDHRVMEFAASLPLEYKLKNGLFSKYILKMAFKNRIPLSFLNRKKRGFGIPVGNWFRNELKGFVRDMLLNKESLKRNLFSESYLKRLLYEHQSKKRDHTHRIFALLSFEMWYRIFMEKRSI